MNTQKFKSTIKCAGCVATVSPALDEAVGKEGWEVDLTHPDRLLTVHGDHITEQAVRQALQKVGYTIEKL